MWPKMTFGFALLLTACASIVEDNTKLTVDFVCNPAGATLYQDNVNMGREPPRVCRRPFGLSYAATAGCSSMV
jgi:hypothetical protein